MNDRRLFRWQGLTLTTLFVGYAGYYVCRSNLSVATPLLLGESQGTITKAQIGTVASVGVLLYAVGKLSNGVLADFLGGRLLFLFGMIASILCTIVFGLAGGLVAFAVIWAVNRYVQSMGWGGLVKIASCWFPVHRHATVMGFLSMSYLLGDAAARLYLGLFIGAGLHWRDLFFLAAGTLGVIAVFSLFTLRESPRDIGAEEPAANPENVFGADGDQARPGSLGSLLLPLLTNPTFLLVCLMNVGLTLIRETFNFWTPTYFTEVAGLEPGAAARWSMGFPLVGAASALVGGWASDRLRGRHGRVVVPSLVLLIAALALLALVPAQGQPLLVLGLISAVSWFLMAPYSFCSGVMALDAGGKRGSSTAAGIIDAAGYLGATLSGFGVGQVAQRYGWPMAFTILAGFAALTLVAAALYWVRQELSPARLSEPALNPVKASMSPIVEHICELFAQRGSAAYIGEPVSQTEHALQAAWAAEKAGASSALIAAALLHDVGHLLHDLPEDCADHGINDAHELRGARWLAAHFGPDVTEPIRLHVPAKRFLCATEPSYRERLSEQSVLSLKLQGGPFSEAEVHAFRQGPHAEAAVALRRWDEGAKIAKLPTPNLEHFRPHLEATLARRT